MTPPGLVDKSALVRLATSKKADEWAERIERGLVRISVVTRLEVGYSARSAKDLRDNQQQAPLAAMPVEYQTPATEDRAMAVHCSWPGGDSTEHRRSPT